DFCIYLLSANQINPNKTTHPPPPPPPPLPISSESQTSSPMAATFTQPRHTALFTAAKPTTRTLKSPTSIRMSLQENAPSLAVVGVTGAVGQEFLSVLSDRDFPYRSIKMLASKRSAGKEVSFQERSYTVEELTADSFDGVDIALFSAGGSISKKFGPAAAEKGTIVVDNSSAFRMVDGIPLVIPEVNPEAMNGIKVGMGKGALIANPNCSTIICLMAATPLHKHAKVLRMVVSTYQAASGAGAAAMEELELQTREVYFHSSLLCYLISSYSVSRFVSLTAKLWSFFIVSYTTSESESSFSFDLQYAFNLFSHNAPVQPNGYNEEEMKLVKETRKIWSDLNVKVTATCIRVPVMRAHAESVNLQFEKPLDEDTAKEILKNAPGVLVIDDRASNSFPTPLKVSNKDDVAVGRIRQDLSQEGNHGLDIFVCGDQIRKGAALNAVQIAEMLLL
ncbi:Aspartate-semialdehyde dehydrogenase, partial [Linum perenne]